MFGRVGASARAIAGARKHAKSGIRAIGLGFGRMGCLSCETFDFVTVASCRHRVLLKCSDHSILLRWYFQRISLKPTVSSSIGFPERLAKAVFRHHCPFLSYMLSVIRLGATATGFRVREEEMRELGTTLPGFKQRAAAIAELPALGLLTLAGMLPESWTCCYHGAPSADEGLIEQVLAEQPDLVAVSALTASIEEAYPKYASRWS